MADRPEISQVNSLNDHHAEALIACGLVDDVVDVSALAPRPYRYAEGEFICKHGDPVDSLWVIVNGSVEPPRVCRRLQLLREWSYDESSQEDIAEIFARGA